MRLRDQYVKHVSYREKCNEKEKQMVLRVESKISPNVSYKIKWKDYLNLKEKNGKFR